MLIDREFNVKEALLLHKELPELESRQQEELARIEKLDVENYTEADIRAEVIDPIVRILGYQKGQFSSVDREKHIRFLGKTHKYIDYSFTLWQENFWIIEAKRPLKGDHFGYSELSQATEYAIHPEINASIIVLCDGIKLEIFDREEDLENPIVTMKIKNLSRDFHLLRKILSPVNIWFFYKRRVLRSIDKAFEVEFNQSRANEFLEIIERRFTEKTNQIRQNFQKMQFDHDVYDRELAAASLDEIIDVHYFMPQSVKSVKVLNSVIASNLEQMGAYKVFSKLMPDYYREFNANYYMYLLEFLIELDKNQVALPYIPCWLFERESSTPESLIEKLIKQMLTYFEEDEPRKIILLASSAYRRIYKMMSVIQPHIRDAAEAKHLSTRLRHSEFSWGQILSSSEGNIVRDLDFLPLHATTRFVKQFSKEKNVFKSALAKHHLNELWSFEGAIFKKYPNYLELMKERDYGELHPTEVIDIVYDDLAHGCLCIVEKYPKWKKYVREHHYDLVADSSALGSWSAGKIVGNVTKEKDYLDSIRVQRFFFGDATNYRELSKQYGYGDS
ncbi:hypothetical protein [Vibrio penaeicida]|uniref:hypothetical protein n=1 Tax=Vibrio penaeicida TaxID=104609 RepID=UPI000CEA3032|nr:hypothetical protein [Vibrio penaeicida]